MPSFADDFLDAPEASASVAPPAPLSSDSFLDAPDASWGTSFAAQPLANSNNKPALQIAGQNANSFKFAPEEGPSSRNIENEGAVMAVAPLLAKQAIGGAISGIGTGIEQTGKVLDTWGGGDPTAISWSSVGSEPPMSQLGHYINQYGKSLIEADPDVKAATQNWAVTPAGYGSFTGVVGAALANPLAGAGVFAGGVAEHMADAAEKAGKPPEIVEQARQVGYGLGLGAMSLPLNQVHRTLEGLNINPFIKQMGGDVIKLIPDPSMQRALLYTGIESAKAGVVGGAAGAGYQVSENALINHYGDQNIPLGQNVASTAAMFAIPSAAGGAIEAATRPIDSFMPPRSKGPTIEMEPTTPEPVPTPTSADLFLDAPTGPEVPTVPSVITETMPTPPVVVDATPVNTTPAPAAPTADEILDSPAPETPVPAPVPAPAPPEVPAWKKPITYDKDGIPIFPETDESFRTPQGLSHQHQDILLRNLGGGLTSDPTNVTDTEIKKQIGDLADGKFGSGNPNFEEVKWGGQRSNPQVTLNTYGEPPVTLKGKKLIDAIRYGLRNRVIHFNNGRPLDGPVNGIPSNHPASVFNGIPFVPDRFGHPIPVPVQITLRNGQVINGDYKGREGDGYITERGRNRAILSTTNAADLNKIKSVKIDEAKEAPAPAATETTGTPPAQFDSIEEAAKALTLPEFDAWLKSIKHPAAGIAARALWEVYGKHGEYAEKPKGKKGKKAPSVSTEAPALTTTESKAVTEEVQTPESIKQTEPVDSAALRGQKKYLLEEIDKALANAPSESEHWASNKLAQEIRNELQLVSNAASRKGELKPLADKYKVSTRRGLEKAVQQALWKITPHIVIQVPGDGMFTITNSKEALTEFKKRAAKFPVAQLKGSDVFPTSRTTPTAIPKVGTLTRENVLTAASLFTAKDPDRVALTHLWTNGKQTVATDGRVLIVINEGVNKVTTPTIVTQKGVITNAVDTVSKDIESKKPAFPKWQQIMPSAETMGKIATIDTARLATICNQSIAGLEMQDTKGKYVKPTLMLVLNPDGTIGAHGSVEVPQEQIPRVSYIRPFDKPLNDRPAQETFFNTYDHNIQTGAKLISGVDPEFVLKVAEAARILGQEKIDLHVSNQNAGESVLVFNWPKGKALVMPVRIERSIQNEILHSADFARPDTTPAPITELPTNDQLQISPPMDGKLYVDPSRAQSLINGIREGQLILNSGLRTNGKKYTKAELAGIARSVANDKAKLAALELLPQPEDQEIQQMRMAKGGSRKPSTSAPAPAPAPTPASKVKIPAPAVQIAHGFAALGNQILTPIRQLLFPASLDGHSERMALIIRDLNGQHAIQIQRADEQLSKWGHQFDKTPVPRGWKYDPTKPLPTNYAFIQAVETGNVDSLSPELQQLATIMRDQLDGLISRVQALAPECLQSVIENYFPHVWKDPKAASRISRMSPSSRPLEGPKGFLKKRTLEYFTDGLRSGLEPISDNPVMIHLFKVAEMSKFIMAQRILSQAEKSGLRKFCGIFKKIPDGYVKVDDPTTKVFSPPFVSVKEAYDVQLRDGMLNLIKQMGWGYERTITNLKAKGFSKDTFGFWNPSTKEIKVKNFTGDLTIAHEIGHGLDQHYGLSDYFNRAISDSALQEKELSALSNAREPDTNKKLFGKVNAKLSKDYHDYIHSRSERMAEVVAAYLYTPDLFRQLAPNIYKAYDQFLMLHSELHEFRDLRPSLERGAEEVQVPVHGMIQVGNYIMPQGAANVLSNYLSPGLHSNGLYQSLRGVSNLLNSATLGLSAFHLGFTSLDAMVSQVSVGLFQALHGNIKSIPTLLTAPAAPVTNYNRGLRLQRAMLDPRKADPQMRLLAQMAIRGGMRATIDPFYKTAFTKNFLRAIAGMRMNLQSGRIPMTDGVHAILNVIPMLIEQGMRPIAEYIVPRQKLGVFAQLAELELNRLGPSPTLEETRRAMASAADTCEDRMGQLTYDNLFHNKVAKDLLMLAFRAYGWQFGKYRAMAKMAGEAAGAANSFRKGEKPKISTNLTYGVALTMTVGLLGAVVMKLLSGKNPESFNDYMMPQTGKLDANGHPQRLMLPSYAKDLISDWHDFPNAKKFGVSFSHKMNPAISICSDMWNNKDFYGTEIRHTDDPAWKQAIQVGKFLGKSFLPFSITGTMKLHESGASAIEQGLPFIGIVPAKASLSMTPAEARAEELFVDSLPKGSRTADQADHAALLNKIKASMRQGNGTAAGLMAQNISQLKTTDLPNIMKESGKSAILLHVEKLNLDQGMSVFDLSNDLERSQLSPLLTKKLGLAVNNNAIAAPQAVIYAKILSAPRK